MIKQNIKGFKYFTCVPRSGIGVEAQFRDCLLQQSEFLKSHNLNSNVIKQTIFLNTISNSVFFATKKVLLEIMKEFFDVLHPYTFVSQPPENGYEVSLEAICYHEPGNEYTISYKTYNNLPYTVITSGSSKKVISSGLTREIEKSDILEQSISAFKLMENILAKESLSFSDIVRQWNYIENITEVIKTNDGESQHYQIFNDIRTLFYNKNKFKNGYPAATGIGMYAGGIIIDFIAINGNDKLQILSIKNPVQTDAHQYSCQVLGENSAPTTIKKTSPKFERAKVIAENNSFHLFISGTSAIRGQATIENLSIEAHTKTTIENIMELISRENLLQHGITVKTSSQKPDYLRIYVKKSKDIPLVKKICETYFKNVPSLYVVSDICRESLLVEIEGAIENH